MGAESIHVSALIPARPADVYEAWLSSEQHGQMTGSTAQIEPRVGGQHRAFGDYITGTTLALDPGRSIVQSWRTEEFPSGSADSKIVVTFEDEGGHTRLRIAHTDIPEGQGASYESGWHEYYFTPMVAYFAGRPGAVVKAPRKGGSRKSTAKKTVRKAPEKTATRAPAKRGAKKTAKKTTAKAPAKRGAKKEGTAGKPPRRKTRRATPAET
jgi:uncharacterized protein YndB with AHSA1/START domain